MDDREKTEDFEDVCGGARLDGLILNNPLQDASSGTADEGQLLGDPLEDVGGGSDTTVTGGDDHLDGGDGSDSIYGYVAGGT